MKVSFDYWGTLTLARWQKEVKVLLASGVHDVYLITRGKYLDKAKEVAAAIGIKPENVITTNGQPKGEVMNALGIDVHYDDDATQIDLIRAVSKTHCIRVNLEGLRH